MLRTVFSNVTLVDGLTPPRSAAVVVSGDSILSVDDAAPAHEPGDVIYDLAGYTLMPGMVSCHTHLTYHQLDVFDLMGSDMKYPAPYLGVVAAKNAEVLLNSGFTSCVGAGGTYNMDVVLKQLIADGLILGPRIVACGKDLCVTGHPVDYKPELWRSAQSAIGEICDSPDEFRKGVRAEAKRGVEVIKLFVEGGHGLPRGARMTRDEIVAAVEAAHGSDIRVRAHAYSRQMIQICVDAGVDIIDHADQMDDELIAQFVDKGIFVVPSLYHMKLMTGITHSAEDTARWFDYAKTSLRAAVEAGVKLTIGDDFGTLQGPHGHNARELSVYTDDIGIDPLEVIKWATVNGAAMMCRDDLGMVAPGKLADLLVLEGDPTRDIGLLARPEKLKLVLQGGQVIRSRLQPQIHRASDGVPST